MKRVITILVFSVLPLLLRADLVTLQNVSGNQIQASIDDYNPVKEVVTIRVNGTGSRVSLKMSNLDAASNKKVKAWYTEYAVKRLIRFEINRVRSGHNSYYELEISSSAAVPVEGLRAEYSIPMIIRKQTQKVSTYTVRKKGNGNKNKKAQKKQRVTYQVHETRKVETGEITIGAIPAGEPMTVETDAVLTETTQQFSGAGKGVKASRKNEHSVKGAVIRIFMGNQLIHTVESSPGVAQLVEKY